MAVARIAITPGEPAGIGPDVTLAAAAKPWDAELVAVASLELLRERAKAVGAALALVHYDPSQPPRAHTGEKLPVLDIPLGASAQPGKLDPANAPYVLATLRQAVAGCLDGSFGALVTGPVQKSVINDAGVPFIGHTEFLADETGTERVVMMLATKTLRVALVTTHLALTAVPAAITQDSVRETIAILHRDLTQRFGIASPRIAVLGLNPHAGEGGHMGREEIEVITPVLDALRGEGMQLSGPLPADTAFNPPILDTHDAVLAMYHDQGLPVLKYSGFGDAINITLGLPIIRTSVDHGTALDIAGSGRADPGSLCRAITEASQLALNFRQAGGQAWPEYSGD